MHKENVMINGFEAWLGHCVYMHFFITMIHPAHHLSFRFLPQAGPIIPLIWVFVHGLAPLQINTAKEPREIWESTLRKMRERKFG